MRNDNGSAKPVQTLHSRHNAHLIALGVQTLSPNVMVGPNH